MPHTLARSRRRIVARSLAALPLSLAALSASQGAWAAPAASSPTGPAAATAAITSSALDGQLFYQLFLAEVELARGEPGVAFQVLMAAAKRSRDEVLYQRTVDVAIGARAGDQALTAAKAWRAAWPKSRRAAQTQAQIMMALGRPADAAEPLRAMLDNLPEGERNAAIASLPSMVVAGQGKPAAAGVIDEVLKPWRAQAATRLTAQVATARAWSIVGETARALDGVREVQKSTPGNEAAALLALDLMGKEPAAESAVIRYLEVPSESQAVRLGYARRLTSAQRYVEALQLTQQVTGASPQLASAWMLQGALQIELQNPRAAQTALQRFLVEADAQRERAAKAGAVVASGEGNDEVEAAGDGGALTEETAQAYLMLAQAAEQLKDYTGAQAWLDKLGEAQSAPTVLTRRAMLLARQGKVKEARALLQALPDSSPEDTRSKVLAETQLLREVKDWKAAYEVLEKANARLPDDADLLYEQALLAERLTRFDDMERLLLRVIALKPDQQHAYNALGYSFADRNLRLDEARQLIQKALDLSPGDPFITDSLAWVEFRLGRREAALNLLRQAYGKRPDTEIGAHLGEVLWTLGQQDEARRVWRAGLDKDATNEVLKDTLHRLKVQP